MSIGEVGVTPTLDRVQNAIFVRVTAIAPANARGLNARTVARRDALAQAGARLQCAALSLKATGYATVGDLFASKMLSDELRASIARGAIAVLDEWDDTARQLTLVAALPFLGPGSPAEVAARMLEYEQRVQKDTGKLPEHPVVGMDIRAIEAPVQLGPGPYTGVIIDTTGLDYVPALLPKLVSQDGAEVWGTVGVSVPVAMKTGLYATATSVAHARALRRVGAMPLVIHPIGTCGVLRGDLVLSAEDIALLARDDAKQALTLLSVALITDKEALAQ
jgi:hypothetical protein